MTRETVEAGMRSGDFRAANPDLVVTAISGLTSELVLHCLRDLDGECIGEIEAFVTDFVENGLVAGGRP
jgi:hypothetical protein